MIAKRCAASILIGAGVMLSVGCAQPRPFDDLWVAARPYRSDMKLTRPPSDTLERDQSTVQAAAETNPDGAITLQDAVVLALRQNPTLRANGWSVAAAEADAMQMGRPPNPTATLSVENFAAPDSLPALPRQTLRISQVIELANKREKRQQLGEARQRLVAWDYEAQRIEIAARTAARYVAVLVAQKRIALTKQQLKLAETAYDIANDRAANGTRPGFERDQAHARAALIQIELDQARQDLASARADLAASWGADEPAFESVGGELAALVELPSLDALQQRLPQSPHVARWADEIALREQAIDLERANAVTDPSLGGGVRYLSELDETVGVAEVSWPLPLLDDNEHGILAARLRFSQAVAEQEAAKTEASRQLSRAYAKAQAASQTLDTLKSKAVPAASAAYEATRDAYEAGQTEYLTTLDAERSLLDLQRLQLDAALAYHKAIIDLEHITASALSQ
ncbi:MAG: TolC family protein [Phycisphaeraceae bacterium]|nr:TolC family protein [Phycisphaeraceae bacterium]